MSYLEIKLYLVYLYKKKKIKTSDGSGTPEIWVCGLYSGEMGLRQVVQLQGWMSFILTKFLLDLMIFQGGARHRRYSEIFENHH